MFSTLTLEPEPVKKLFTLVLASLLFCACSRAAGEKSLLVMCGSANKPAMQEIAARYEQETGVKIHLLYGGSGTLLSQIELARKGDVYLPASADYISKAERKHLLIPGSTRQVCYLIPAIITPKGNPKGIKTLADLSKNEVKVAIGNPETVCLGLYAVELLEKNHLLEPVMKNVVVYGGNCSRLVNLITMKKVDAIIGWRVVHFWNPGAMDFIPIDGKSLVRISYIPIAIPVYARDRTESQRFIDYVVSEKGKNIYRKHGYVTDKIRARSYAGQAAIGGEYTLPAAYFQLVRQPRP